MWDLVPQPGIELISPALEGRFLTTGSPGKSFDFHSTIYSYENLPPHSLLSDDSNEIIHSLTFCLDPQGLISVPGTCGHIINDYER